MGELTYRAVVEVIPASDGGGYCARIPEFGKGCRADGDTPDDALTDLEDVLSAIAEKYLTIGWPLPAEAQSNRRK